MHEYLSIYMYRPLPASPACTLVLIHKKGAESARCWWAGCRCLQRSMPAVSNLSGAHPERVIFSVDQYFPLASTNAARYTMSCRCQLSECVQSGQLRVPPFSFCVL